MRMDGDVVAEEDATDVEAVVPVDSDDDEDEEVVEEGEVEEDVDDVVVVDVPSKGCCWA